MFQFKDMQMLHLSVAYLSCRTSNLREAYVTCHSLSKQMSHVAKPHVTLLNLRNGHVALSILAVNTPKQGLSDRMTWTF